MYNSFKILIFLWLIMTIMLFREFYLFIKEEKKKNEE